MVSLESSGAASATGESWWSFSLAARLLFELDWEELAAGDGECGRERERREVKTERRVGAIDDDVVVESRALS